MNKIAKSILTIMFLYLLCFHEPCIVLEKGNKDKDIKEQVEMQSEHLPKGLKNQKKSKDQKVLKKLKINNLKIENYKYEELEYYNNKKVM